MANGRKYLVGLIAANMTEATTTLSDDDDQTTTIRIGQHAPSGLEVHSHCSPQSTQIVDVI